MAEEKLLVVDNLKMYFHTRDGVVKAVDGVSYELNSGETLGVVGESGSGKSVTALTMMRLIPMPPGRIEGGDVLFRGQSLLSMSDEEIRKIRGNRIAMVFQDPMTSLNPVYRVGRQIAEPLILHKGMRKKEALARAVELLDLVGIPHAASRVKDYPHQFSGGMRQRVMIAMALANDPDILIADEPTTALDVTIQAQILELMEELQKRIGSAIILITHDLGVVADQADNVLVMYAGRPVEYGSVDQLFYRPLHPYTWGLMDSLPEYAVDEKSTLCPIKGQPPSLINVPDGCAFHPRCPFAKDVCFTDVPQFIDIDGSHGAACHFAGDAGFTRAEASCTVPVSTEEVAL
jgi:oligopeptide transport system ATP-binding protein